MDPVIKKAEERLEWLSSDEETRRLYEYRQHSIIGRNSIIADSIEKGMEKGIAKVGLTMLEKGLDASYINDLTGCSLEEIERIKAIKSHTTSL